MDISLKKMRTIAISCSELFVHDIYMRKWLDIRFYTAPLYTVKQSLF